MLSKQQVNALRANRQVTRAVQVMVFVAVASVAALSIASVNQAFPSPPDAPAGALQGARYLQSQSSPGVVVPKKTTIRGPGSVAPQEQPRFEMNASQPLIPPKGGSSESVMNAFKQLPFKEEMVNATGSVTPPKEQPGVEVMASQPPAVPQPVSGPLMNQRILVKTKAGEEVLEQTFTVYPKVDNNGIQSYTFQVSKSKADPTQVNKYLTGFPEKKKNGVPLGNEAQAGVFEANVQTTGNRWTISSLLNQNVPYH
jgi:hypothetical protein